MTVWIFAGSLFVGLALLFTLIMLSDSHAAVCSMVNTKLDSISGPLSRELALGAEETSRAIFADFVQELNRTNIKQEIHLDTAQAQTSIASACQAHFFNVTLNYPLQFAGVKQGTVTGTLS